MWGRDHRVDVLTAQLSAHLEDCKREREAATSSRLELSAKMDAYHESNKKRLAGIYWAAWSVAASIIVGLFGALAWAIANLLTWRVPVNL